MRTTSEVPPVGGPDPYEDSLAEDIIRQEIIVRPKQAAPENQEALDGMVFVMDEEGDMIGIVGEEDSLDSLMAHLEVEVSKFQKYTMSRIEETLEGIRETLQPQGEMPFLVHMQFSEEDWLIFWGMAMDDDWLRETCMVVSYGNENSRQMALARKKDSTYWLSSEARQDLAAKVVQVHSIPDWVSMVYGTHPQNSVHWN